MGFNYTQFDMAWFDLSVFDGSNTSASPIVQDTTNERDLPEHMDWRAKILPLPKVLRPLR